MTADEPRLLAKRSELGYVDRLDRAMPDEPEAVPPDVQAWITINALDVRRARDREEFDGARALIEQGLAVFTSSASFARLGRDAHLIERVLDRMSRRLS